MQRRKKQKNELERWAERAAEGIIFRPDQREVERELLAHLEDKAADLARIFPDMEREEAEKRAVEQMGDPKEIGRALARLHRPWLGWLWRLSQIALAWAVLWSLREAVPDLLRGNQYWFQEQVYLSAQDCYLMGEDPYGPEGALTGEVPEAAERELLALLEPETEKLRVGWYRFWVEAAALWSLDRERWLFCALGVDQLPWEKLYLDPMDYVTGEDSLGNHYPSMAAERENSLGVTGGAEWSQFHKNLIFSVPNVPEGVEWVRLSYDRGGVAWSVTVPLK